MKSTKKKKEKTETIRNLKSFLRTVRRKSKFNSFGTKDQKARNHSFNIENKVFQIRKESLFSKFHDFITPNSGSILLTVPKDFCLCNNYHECMGFINEFASSIYDYTGFIITLDFTKCKKADSAALFALQIIRLELINTLSKLQRGLKSINIVPEIKVTNSKSLDVLRLMKSTGYPINYDGVQEIEIDSSLVPVDMMGYFKGKGSQKHYSENKKSIYAAKIISYLNKCLSKHGYNFSDIHKNKLNGIIGEVLSNAEDHSHEGTWFISGNFSREDSKNLDDVVGELNLTIMNIGESFYEGFIQTKEKNREHFNSVREKVNELLINNPNLSINEEQIFTLWMMSDGISRLNFHDPSRGTGTMKFINSFVDLGDFEDIEKGFTPNLSLFTGYTQLICDNQYKPFKKESVFCLSLNPENNLNLPPKESHLKVLKKRFPGTLLSIKIYLNKKHLDIKYGGANNEKH